MKIIDLLVKISKGEEVPKKIRIDHWSYKFEWEENLNNYYDNSVDIDLMSVLCMSKEELNYGVEIIEEEKKLEESSKVVAEDKVFDPIETYTLEITAKRSQLLALREFLKNNNMDFKRVENKESK